MLTLLATGRKNHTACGIGRGVCAFAANGDAYPYPSFLGLAQTRLGSSGACQTERVLNRRRTAVDGLPVCRSCWARSLRGGGCFYDNLARSGDMHRPDPLFCRETRAVCEDLVAGWCMLSEDDRSYVREQTEERDDSPRP